MKTTFTFSPQHLCESKDLILPTLVTLNLNELNLKFYFAKITPQELLSFAHNGKFNSYHLELLNHRVQNVFLHDSKAIFLHKN